MTGLTHNTFLAPEELAYPNGGQTRPCRAIWPDGKVRRVWAGIPDTFFSIPSHGTLRGRYVAGFVMVDDRSVDCPHCFGAWSTVDGKCEHCQFGLVDSPTRGALIFHPNRRSVQRYNAWVSENVPGATLGDYMVPDPESEVIA